jgi:hypothetical protein
VDGDVGGEPRREAVDAAAVQGIDEESRIRDGSNDCVVGKLDDYLLLDVLINAGLLSSNMGISINVFKSLIQFNNRTVI